MIIKQSINKMDSETYYFGDRRDGCQLAIRRNSWTGYRDNLFNNRPVLEIGLQQKWYYFGQDGALLEQTDKQVLEAKK